ncbi:hypothetical protein J4E90_000092 [Alternaria incomplexa]|uniref:uncharacterized protein n=1 Tax=Alternaria incomplexa TaxID=1187928 RepID=UPI002220424E|nr:uncharacterized protein J4E90_000092 [Alternaria incomplexa]KAI4921666.1 hypothetical protein J4E90_000092 [Alternaria incomplexa]
MEAIAEKHAGFISRLTKLLDLFVTMRYISPSDIIRPPHSSETVATSIFEKIGLNSKVIQLIRLIPAMRSENVEGWQWFGVELTPRSKAVTYFADSGDTDFVEDLRWGERYHDENTKLLPPHMLRLTSGDTYSGHYGTDLIYDTQDQSIIEWSSVGPDRNEWEKASRRPAETVLDEIIAKFQSLEWVPYYDPREDDDPSHPPARKILEDPIIMQNLFPGGIRLPTDTTAAIQHLRQQNGPDGADWLRRYINRVRAWQKIYLDCGWGSGAFDGEAFELKRAEFIEALEELDDLESEARNRPWLISIGAQQVVGEDTPTLEQVTLRLDHFLVQAAGELAV